MDAQELQIHYLENMFPYLPQKVCRQPEGCEDCWAKKPPCTFWLLLPSLSCGIAPVMRDLTRFCALVHCQLTWANIIPFTLHSLQSPFKFWCRDPNQDMSSHKNKLAIALSMQKAQDLPHSHRIQDIAITITLTLDGCTGSHAYISCLSTTACPRGQATDTGMNIYQLPCFSQHTIPPP